MKVKFINLGCRSNSFDTELMANLIRKQGFSLCSEGPADVYIVNTCTVTSEADRSSRQAIYRAKRENPQAVVVATGCYAQVNPGALAKLREVDLVVGNSEKHRIAQIIEEFLERKENRVYASNIFRQSSVENFDLIAYFEKSRPFVKIQEGCNNFCSFCVIPFARGKVRSVKPSEVIKELQLLAERGFQEVVISGTQLTQYGWEIGTNLYELLRELLKIKGIELLRLSSLYPSEITPELLELIVSEEKIAPHFHLSLQSGSNRILELMERGYEVEDYIRLVEKITQRRPISAIGTDIIVGFPTEKEEDFLQTYSLLKELPIAYMHVFSYSDRPFTKASKMEGKINSETKKERVRILKELDREKREAFYRAQKGRVLRAVVLEDKKLLTENYIELEREVSAPAGKVVKILV